MGILDFWKKEKREDAFIDEQALSDQLLTALIGTNGVNRDVIMNIPSVAACVNKIGDTVASLPVKLYQRIDDRVDEIKDDARLRLLNVDTGDTLDAFQFKKALILDMFLARGGYAFVNRMGNEVKSLHYVDARNVSFLVNADPIFKDFQILVNGRRYEGWQFIKLLRNTQNGVYGRSIIEDCQSFFDTVYATQKFEQNLVKTGGNKKGFLQSTIHLGEAALKKLKEAFRRAYSNNTENVIILNEGLSFKESSNSSVEMQLNENKETNSNDVCKIFLIPPSIINGGASEEDKKLYYDSCILPLLNSFNTAINNVLLLDSEKNDFFFAFDDSDLIKGDIEKRFAAYEIACRNGFMQIDEVRTKERLPAFGLEFIKLGLQDVLYYPESKEIYTPNTNKLSVMGAEPAEPVQDSGGNGTGDKTVVLPGKENDADRNQE